MPIGKLEDAATTIRPTATTSNPVDRTRFTPKRSINRPAGIAINMLARPLTPVNRPTCEKLRPQDFSMPGMSGGNPRLEVCSIIIANRAAM